ncbi:MAG TPA: 2-hydroxyacid dehydrogenase [Dermatophilaceae bacterium]
MPVIALPDQEWIDLVGPVAGVEMVPWDMTGEPPRGDEIAFVVPPYFASTEWERLGTLPALRMVQLLTAGYDNVLAALPAGVRLANAAGVHDASTAEMAMTLTLSSLRNIPAYVAAQERSQWLPLVLRPSLADKKVLILGYGGIGAAIARRLRGFEVSLTAVASRARGGDELVTSVHGVDELPALLPEHDIVIVIVPLSEATTGLVDRDFLASMPEGALLVNVSRGKVVDTEALVEAVRTGRVTAALDVTDPEPLPAEHPLWRLPGVLISPHVGGASSAFTPRAVSLLREQIAAFAGEQPLRNVVNRD